jgi:hypothetical protein
MAKEVSSFFVFFERVFDFVILVKSKFSHAYSQEFPYRINHILECEFFLLEAMVSNVSLLNVEVYCNKAMGVVMIQIG